MPRPLLVQAQRGVTAATTVEDVVDVEQVMARARYHWAAVLALQAGEEVPERRDPCLFDPRHGPSTKEVPWAPPLGTIRTVPVCAADARRLDSASHNRRNQTEAHLNRAINGVNGPGGPYG